MSTWFFEGLSLPKSGLTFSIVRLSSAAAVVWAGAKAGARACDDHDACSSKRCRSKSRGRHCSNKKPKPHKLYE